MNRIQLILATTALAFSTFAGSFAAAAVTVFETRSQWQAAAGSGPTIDFSTTDAGTPITDPPAYVQLPSLTLKGVTFRNIRSYYNEFINAAALTTMRIELPANTTAFAMDLTPMTDAPGTYTIRLSSGETFNPLAGTIPMEYDFFGLTSTAPIQWIELSLDSAVLVVDNFSFVAAPSVLQAAIDIVPGSQINPVKPGSGDVDVAILSTSTLNAMNVNVSTVRFGAKGTEAAVKKFTYRDVNGDRVKDLVMEFKMKDTGIVCKATTAKLTGKMKDGKQIAGSGSIKTVNCK